MPAIELVIDELILHGFPATDRARIGDAIHAELVRQLTDLGDPTALAALGQRASLDAGSFELAPSATAAAIGGHVARSVLASATGGGKR